MDPSIRLQVSRGVIHFFVGVLVFRQHIELCRALSSVADCSSAPHSAGADRELCHRDMCDSCVRAGHLCPTDMLPYVVIA